MNRDPRKRADPCAAHSVSSGNITPRRVNKHFNARSPGLGEISAALMPSRDRRAQIVVCLAHRHVALIRGPQDAILGTACSNSAWQAPPMTSRSPDAGRKSMDLPPPNGRKRNGLVAPRVTMAMMVSFRCRSSRSRVEGNAVAPIAVVVEAGADEGDLVDLFQCVAHHFEPGVRRLGALAGPPRQAGLVNDTLVHAPPVLGPGHVPDQLLAHRVRAEEPTSTHLDPAGAIQLRPFGSGTVINTDVADTEEPELQFRHSNPWYRAQTYVWLGLTVGYAPGPATAELSCATWQQRPATTRLGA